MNMNEIRTSLKGTRLSRTLAIAAFAFAVSASHAEWQALTKSPGQNVDFSVSLNKQAGQSVTVQVPGYNLDTVTVEGKTYSVITVPGFPGLTEKGNPDVPRLGANFLVGDAAKPGIKIISNDFVDIKLEHPLVSSKGHLTRDISPSSLPYTFSEVYKKDAFFPETALASVSEPFVMHNLNGVSVQLNFFQYNPVTQVLRVHKSVELALDNSVSTKGGSKSVPSFLNQALDQGFVNSRAVKSALGLRKVNEAGRMLIICFDDFVSAMTPFIEWKKKSGLDVKLVKASEAGKTAADIRAFVKKEFEAGNLSYLHLVGDVEQIPTLRGTVEGAASDQSYGLIAGNDWFLDIIVSRFSAKTADKVAYQVAKTIRYEANPDTAQATNGWYRQGTGIASNEGNPKDWAYADTIRTGLMKFTYDAIDQIYDPKANAAMVGTAVNQGRSVINYIGHGSSQAWVSSGFSVNNIKELKNGAKLPYIWSVACVNGAFAGPSESFAETWLNAGSSEDLKGAVAIAAASTNMEWVPPLYWQAEANLVLLPAGNDKTFGGLSLGGMSAIAAKYGADSKSFKLFVEQTNNFGDGSLKIRYDRPASLALGEVKLAGGKMQTQVLRQGTDKGLSGLTVTVYNKDLSQVKVGQTDEQGNVSFDLGTQKAEELAMTITGANVVPLVDEKVSGRTENFKKLYSK